jgi:hypothetical protein
MKLNAKFVVGGIIAAIVASVGAVALAAGGPSTSAVQGQVTLTYRKPFTSCQSGGATYRQVRNWVGTGTVSSNNGVLDGQRLVDKVDFVQNVDTGVGVVTGTLKTRHHHRTTGKGTFNGVWQGNEGEGQLVIDRTGKHHGAFILNAGLHLHPVPNGLGVDITFGSPPAAGAPQNLATSFNERTC